MPRKLSGEIGPTKLTLDSSGTTKAEYIPVLLPDNKDDLERFFGERFIVALNRTPPDDKFIILNWQKIEGTAELDYKIECEVANRMELAELTPLSEGFGRLARKSGSLNVYEFSRWIFSDIVNAKQIKYGDTAKDTMLLLYSTHPQFLTSESVIDCLRSIMKRELNMFAAIFVYQTDGGTLDIIRLISPYKGKVFGAHHFRRVVYHNLWLGQPEWATLRNE